VALVLHYPKGSGFIVGQFSQNEHISVSIRNERELNPWLVSGKMNRSFPEEPHRGRRL
jgi:hypothetical protein